MGSPRNKGSVIKVIRVIIINWVLVLGPFTEAVHSVTSMRAYNKSFLQLDQANLAEFYLNGIY